MGNFVKKHTADAAESACSTVYDSWHSQNNTNVIVVVTEYSYSNLLLLFKIISFVFTARQHSLLC